MSENDKSEFSNHLACQTLTGLALEHLPRDGSLGRIRRYRKGEDIWQPDDRADRIYFLKRGQVTVMTSDPEGHEVIMQVIKTGEPFGELCFCSQEKGLRHTIGRAVNETEALEIKHSDFVNYLHQHRDALTAFVFTFCERLSDAERRLELLAHRGANDRLGRLLIQIATTPGEGEGEVVLHVSHDELAQMAAMSRAHVTVTMGKFRRQGLVRYERNRPLVVNVPALKAYLDSAKQGRAEEKKRKR